MAYDYTQYQVQLGTLMGITSASPSTPPSDPYFAQILPACIDYAEQKIYRDLDIQSTTTDGTVFTTNGNALVNLPTNPAVYVIESMSIQSLNGGAPPFSDDLTLRPVDKNFLMATYPPAYWSTAQGQPEYYYIQDQGVAMVGPAPDGVYGIYCVYTFRPTPLSAGNPTTILTQIWPDLFLAASMIFMSGYQKNFGSQSDDPRMAASWESQYQNLLRGALEEEARKKNQAVDYTPLRMAKFSSRAPATPAAPPMMPGG